MAVLSFVKELFNPVKDIIDEVHYSGEEKQAAQLAVMEAELAMAAKVLEYETKQMELQSQIIIAEGKGESWLQRNWRPLLMVSITSILVNNYILIPWLHAAGATGAPILEFPDGLWTLLTLGVGGYIVGRSAEKTKDNWSINIGGQKLEKKDN